MQTLCTFIFLCLGHLQLVLVTHKLKVFLSNSSLFQVDNDFYARQHHASRVLAIN